MQWQLLCEKEEKDNDDDDHESIYEVDYISELQS